MPSAYDEVLYPGSPFGQTHPDRLAALAALFGMEPAPVERCRVLELGCGDGGNLIPMAFDLPGSEFLGIDAACVGIRAGREAVACLGLTNIRLEHADLMDCGPELGQFDFVIAHGLYSWLPEPVREKLMAVAKAALAPHGVAYISYNALPGCSLRGAFRDMMRFHVSGATDAGARLQSSRELLELIASSQSDSRRFLRDQAREFLERSAPALYHDELSDHYFPLYFHEFLAHAAPHGLQFLCEAAIYDMQPTGIPEAAVAQVLRQSNGDRVLRDQYFDFLKWRKFRQTLLCHAGIALNDSPAAERIPLLFASSAAKPVSAKIDLRPGIAEEFHAPRGAAVKTAHVLAKAAMATLTGAWPESLPFAGLLAATAKLTGEDEDAPALAQILLYSFEAGVTELHARAPRCVSTVSRLPKASALARWQASRGKRITTLRHTTVEVDGEVERSLLALLDGTRDVAALSREVAPLVNLSQEAAAGGIEAALARLAPLAVLMA